MKQTRNGHWRFDRLRFWRAINRTRTARGGLSLRQVAEESGVPMATLWRLQLVSPKADVLARLCQWMGTTPDEFIAR